MQVGDNGGLDKRHIVEVEMRWTNLTCTVNKCKKPIFKIHAVTVLLG